MRKLFRLILAVAVAALLATGSAAQQKASPAKAAGPTDTRPTDEKAIRAETEAWPRAAVAKDGEKFASFYAPDANLFRPTVPW